MNQQITKQSRFECLNNARNDKTKMTFASILKFNVFFYMLSYKDRTYMYIGKIPYN